jgi:hypothetical protein
MKLSQIIATATTAAVLGTAGVSIAGATSGGGNASPPSATASDTSGGAPSTGRARHRRQVVRNAIQLAAKTIGVEPADLLKELRAGKTIADVATAHHVDPQTVIDALVQAAKDKIEAAKTAGKLTSEQASKLEEHAPERIARFVNEWHPQRAGVGP